MVGIGVPLLAVVVVAPLYTADRYLAQSYATENPWEALETVESAQRFNPVDSQLQQREAELVIQIGAWPRIMRAYGEAIQLNPEHYAPRVLLAQFYAVIGETEEAISSYREALALNPLDEEINREIEQFEAKGETR